MNSNHPLVDFAFEQRLIDGMEETAFVAELVQAANKVDRISLDERLRLLRRAAETISRLRIRARQVDARVDDTSDIVIQIQQLCDAISGLSAPRLASTLLACAEVIRSLRIFIEANNL